MQPNVSVLCHSIVGIGETKLPFDQRMASNGLSCVSLPLSLSFCFHSQPDDVLPWSTSVKSFPVSCITSKR